VRDEAEHKAGSEAVGLGWRRSRDAEGINVLAVIHGTNARGGIFRETIEDAGHGYDEWSLAWGTRAPRPLDDYDAVIVFGGSMHADQDDHHPWLRDENEFILHLVERDVPLLGVCLGVQLIAKAAGEAVYRMPDGPEIGWVPVARTRAAADDPVFRGLPDRFDAFGWHYYTYDVPQAAEVLVTGPRCNQAYRLGETTWGIQFHAEVTLETVRSWLDDKEEFPLDLDRDVLWAETQEKIGSWNELGRDLCAAFLDVASARRAGKARGELTDVRA
jgi:GMP synthase-like glutamine amidotransferase